MEKRKGNRFHETVGRKSREEKEQGSSQELAAEESVQPARSRVDSNVRLCRYIVKLQDNQSYSVTLQKEDVITLAIDANGNVFPERFQSALDDGILQEEKGM